MESGILLLSLLGLLATLQHIFFPEGALVDGCLRGAGWTAARAGPFDDTINRVSQFVKW